MLFTKMHGLGNDFIVIDAPDAQKYGYPSLAQRLCDRHTGIGADGLIVVVPSAQCDLRMRIFNQDGSEAEMCGNGIRCFAKYAYERGRVERERFTVETLAGVVEPEIMLERGEVLGVRVKMGKPGLQRGDVPMQGPAGRVINEQFTISAGKFRISALSMGVPHAVVFVDSLEAAHPELIGPQIERHPSFPQRTNVTFARVIDSRNLEMRTWERGAGLTLACGTGACAAAVAGFLNGLTGRRVTARLKLGELNIEYEKDETVYMTGPAKESFVGEIAL